MMMMRKYLLLLLPLLLLIAVVNSLVIRPATSKDIFSARKILFQEAMNPLSISERTLLVACDDDDDDDDDDNDNDKIMVGFGQVRPLDAAYSELASLYVDPDHRHQGIGSALVEKILERHDADVYSPSKVCLLTLLPTTKFYEPHGFVVQTILDDLPATLQFEFKAGSLVSSFLGNDICCMVRDKKKQNVSRE
jgi:ribosomal protein S18 acetylase RimI-like enzyme